MLVPGWLLQRDWKERLLRMQWNICRNMQFRDRNNSDMR